MSFLRLVAGAMVGLVVSACSGGSTSAPGGNVTAASGTAQFAFTFYDPSLSGRTRRPKFASNQTASITIAVNNAADPLLFNLGGSICNAAGTVCGISVSAPAGNDTFTITLYDALFAKGNVLGTQTVSALIVAGVAQQIPLSIAAVPFSIALRLAPGTAITPGTPASIPIELVAFDEGGARIIGSYASPIPVSLQDPSGSTTLSASAVTGSAQSLTLAYNGSSNFTHAQIQSTLPGTTTQVRTDLYSASALIYVSAPFANAIYAYPLSGRGMTPPAFSIAGAATQLNNPEGLTFDAAGNMYVLNAPPGAAHSITVYGPGASGNVAPLRTIAGAKTLLDAAYGDLALDSSGNLVAHTRAAVLRFVSSGSGNIAPVSIISGLTAPLSNGMAFDSAGNLYLIAPANGPADPNGKVLVFPPSAKGQATPARTIGGAASGILNALCLRVDTAGNVYVLANDVNLVFWPDVSTIAVFPAASQGNVAAASALGGADTSLGGAQSIAFDSGGYVYAVAPYGTSRIVTHLLGSSGDARPVQVLLDSSFAIASGSGSPMAIAIR